MKNAGAVTTKSVGVEVSAAILKVLAGAVITHRLFGTDEARVSSGMIEPDGRKESKAMKSLVSAGYIRQEDRKGPPFRCYTATSLAYDLLDAAKPDLTRSLSGPRSSWDLERTHGVVYDTLPHAERKWIVEHKADYAFFECCGMGDARPVADLAAHYQKFGRGDLIVQDEAFRTQKTGLLREARFEQAYQRNLGWGLSALGIIEPCDEDVFKAVGDNHILVARGLGAVFGVDPSKWETNATEGLQRLRDDMARAARYANVITKAADRIEAFGGWAAVLAAYKAKLEAEMAAHDEKVSKDAKEAES